MTMPPLYDGHGHTIQDPADHHHTNDEVNDFIDGVRDIPKHDRVGYFNAIRVHWDFIHFGDGGDQVNIKVRKDGSINVLTLPFDYGDFLGYPGLDVAPPGTTE